MNNLNRAESHRRLKAQTAFEDLKGINIYDVEYRDVCNHIERIQNHSNRNSRLTWIGVILALAKALIPFLEEKYPPEIIGDISMIITSLVVLLILYLGYQYFTFKHEEIETMKKWGKRFVKHDESEIHLVDIPFNELPHLPLNPPSNNGLRIESG